jgi:aerobic-type carbon monoxide dehydrogenase small subunit (CoxS/CutS family)
MIELNLTINGESKVIQADPTDRLLDLLRTAGFLGAKEGCGQGECGACTIILNGKSVTSCLIIASQVPSNSVIVTIESTNGLISKIKQSFIDYGASQCGFCIPGFIVSSYILLSENSKPTDQEIKEGLAGNICRCTGYTKIFEAVKEVSLSLEEN